MLRIHNVKTLRFPPGDISWSIQITQIRTRSALTDLYHQVENDGLSMIDDRRSIDDLPNVWKLLLYGQKNLRQLKRGRAFSCGGPVAARGRKDTG